VSDAADRSLVEASAGPRLGLIAESFFRLTSQRLVPPDEDAATALWGAARVILAHGTGADPVFFYANRMALDRFEVTAAQLVRMPSRLSAEPLLREERAALLARVTRDGFIDDYAGIRVSATGRRFRIEQAVVWNLIDAAGTCHGQAATFGRWTEL
jgi:MEKHLA domain